MFLLCIAKNIFKIYRKKLQVYCLSTAYYEYPTLLAVNFGQAEVFFTETEVYFMQ